MEHRAGQRRTLLAGTVTEQFAKLACQRSGDVEIIPAHSVV
jgi:hypothetical protein